MSGPTAAQPPALRERGLTRLGPTDCSSQDSRDPSETNQEFHRAAAFAGASVSFAYFRKLSLALLNMGRGGRSIESDSGPGLDFYKVNC